MHCPRCSRDYELPSSTEGYFACKVDPKPIRGCFVHEHWYDLHRGKHMAERAPLLQTREKTHGDFRLNAAISQRLKEDFDAPYQIDHGPCCPTSWSRLSPSQREALDMIALKLSRILSGQANFKDHWDDIAGYAKLGSEACGD